MEPPPLKNASSPSRRRRVRRRPAPAGATTGGGSEVVWTLRLTERQRVVWGFLPCLNRGWGEEAWRWGGPFEYRGAAVRSAAGARTSEGWGRSVPGSLAYVRGTTTGEEWVGTEFEHKVVFRTNRDGSFEAWGPGSELLTHLATGRRVLLHFVAHLWVDADGKLSPRPRCSVTDCRYL